MSLFIIQLLYAKTVASRHHFSCSGPGIVLSCLLLVLYLLSNKQCLTNFLCLTGRKKLVNIIIHNSPASSEPVCVETIQIFLTLKFPSCLCLKLIILLLVMLPYPKLPLNIGFQTLSKSVMLFSCPYMQVFLRILRKM